MSLHHCAGVVVNNYLGIADSQLEALSVAMVVVEVGHMGIAPTCLLLSGDDRGCFVLICCRG